MAIKPGTSCKVCLFLLTTLLFFNLRPAAQTDAIQPETFSFKRNAAATDRAPQAVYFGIGGPGLIISLNYDRRFAKKPDGLGFTVGVGGFYVPDELTILSVPVSLNYLFGKRNHFFELAGGASFVALGEDGGDWDTEYGSGVIWHASAGYRYQRSPRGFFFRGGFSPLFGGGDALVFFYVGFGVSF